jgi:hypothetical protein
MMVIVVAAVAAVNIDDSGNTAKVWPYFVSTMIVPGSGQILSGSPIKGGSLLALEVILLSSSYNDGVYLSRKYKNRIVDINEQLKGDFSLSERVYFKGNLVSSDSIQLKYDAETDKASKLYYDAIGLRTMAFATGIYVTSLVDCWYSLRPKIAYTDRSAKGAFWRSMLIPGWGQIYNGKPVKACLTLTALAGLGMNIVQWNKLGNYHETISSSFDAAANNIDTEVGDSLVADRNRLQSRSDAELRDSSRYYSRRNENIWYAFAIYLFASFDAVVDAHLTGFDKKIQFSFIPENGSGIKLSACLSVKP